MMIEMMIDMIMEILLNFFCLILTYECYPMISAPMNDVRSCLYSKQNSIIIWFPSFLTSQSIFQLNVEGKKGQISICQFFL